MSDKWSLLEGGEMILMGEHDGATGKAGKVLHLAGVEGGDLCPGIKVLPHSSTHFLG